MASMRVFISSCTVARSEGIPRLRLTRSFSASLVCLCMSVISLILALKSYWLATGRVRMMAA
eukprot:scaffold260934_cov32-Tisochrysis_lutea.AAC.2